MASSSTGCLEARTGATGRCAELTLTASGGARESVLTAALGALQTGLPTALSVETCAAGREVMDALRTASLAMQAELAHAATACATLRVSQDAAAASKSADAAGAAAAAFAREVGVLQSVTDAHMSALHRLIGVAVR